MDKMKKAKETKVVRYTYYKRKKKIKIKITELTGQWEVEAWSRVRVVTVPEAFF